ncbi:zinc transporter ZIP3 [Lepeophtheirus salmonis]|uniref:zinc transporter ZIP3 n=1 Tax=Lepeophtheirus salmonis TaxID=72036 RepID=UPI001AE8B08F|nr:zinc transporter ZIP3-like [Lepeophtheirus salmonis]
MELLSLKVSILIITFLTTLVFAFLPWKIVKNVTPFRETRTNDFISLGNCFCGGVFLSVTFLYLLPHIRQEFTDVFHLIAEPDFLKDYPVAELVFVFGFLGVFFMEQMMLFYKEHRGNRSISRADYVRTSPRLEDETLQSDNLEEDNHEETVSVLRSFTLMLALSLHSIFEGLAIGLQQSEKELWHIFTAIVSHKLIMSFSFGMNVCQSKIRLRTYIAYIIIFSISSPLGIGIGSGLNELPPSPTLDLIKVFLTGFTGGTFLFLTFFEIISTEFTKTKVNRALKFFFLIVGFIGMSRLLVLHSHE